MNEYKVRNSEGLKLSVKADYLRVDCDKVFFNRTVAGKSDQCVALFINPISVILEDK